MTTSEKPPKFNGLSKHERNEIYILRGKGYSMRDIAKTLKRSPNTISYELKKNSTKLESTGEIIYDPEKANNKGRLSHRFRRLQWMKIEQHPKLRAFIIDKMENEDWSPDTIAGHLKYEQTELPYVSTPQIYAWLYSSRGQQYCPYLLSKRYKPKKRPVNKTERAMIPNRVGIEKRPEEVMNRERAGDWEGDTIVSGKRTGGKAALAVFQERSTRLLKAVLVPNLKPENFANAAVTSLKGLQPGDPAQVRTELQILTQALTLTLDNGIENRHHEVIAATLGISIYFCDAYSSWQKGGVENGNKMYRRYIPKGCDLGNYTQQQIDEFTRKINNKPRRCLGYKSALQLATEKGIC